MLEPQTEPGAVRNRKRVNADIVAGTPPESHVDTIRSTYAKLKRLVVQGEQPVAQHTEAADHSGDAAAQHGQAPPHVELPPVLGEELNSVSNGGRTTLLITQGKSRPVDPKIASMFATACSAAVRDTVPILPHWKQYKGRHEIFSMYVAHLSVSFATHLTVHSM